MVSDGIELCILPVSDKIAKTAKSRSAGYDFAVCVILLTSHLMSLNVDVLELSVVDILRLLHADLLLERLP